MYKSMKLTMKPWLRQENFTFDQFEVKISRQLMITRVQQWVAIILNSLDAQREGKIQMSAS